MALQNRPSSPSNLSDQITPPSLPPPQPPASFPGSVKGKNLLIRVTKSHNNYYVWNPADIVRLRREYRIIGHFVGSLPNAGVQLQAFGLPLQLSPQEVGLLTTLDVISMTNIVRDKPSNSLVDEFKQYRAKVADEYLELSIKEKVENIMHNKDNILASFRSKNFCQNTKSDEEIIEEKLAATKKTESNDEKSPIQIYNGCPFKQFIKPATQTLSSYLSDVKYHVFKDLWVRNYYITSGAKFACDFLAYESDPHICHSKFMVVCIDCNKVSLTKNEPLVDSLSSQVRGRLSVQVNKRLVFALVKLSPSNSNDVAIEYQEFRWRGKNRLKSFHK